MDRINLELIFPAHYCLVNISKCDDSGTKIAGITCFYKFVLSCQYNKRQLITWVQTVKANMILIHPTHQWSHWIMRPGKVFQKFPTMEKRCIFIAHIFLTVAPALIVQACAHLKWEKKFWGKHHCPSNCFNHPISDDFCKIVSIQFSNLYKTFVTFKNQEQLSAHLN